MHKRVIRRAVAAAMVALLMTSVAVFADTVVPRDFDVIEVPFPERGAPVLVKAGARPVSSVGDGALGAGGTGG